jgi:hypothetical protein
MAVGKRLRFEIFKRDGFRCQYCGATPVQEPLQCDHIIPVASGGTNDPENLITSCAACNIGKSSVSLAVSQIRATLPIKEQRDRIEQLAAYLEFQKQIAAAQESAVRVLHDYWISMIGPMSQETLARLRRASQEWSHDKLVEAMNIVSSKMGRPGAPFDSYVAESQGRYFGGILRNWRHGVRY